MAKIAMALGLFGAGLGASFAWTGLENSRRAGQALVLDVEREGSAGSGQLRVLTLELAKAGFRPPPRNGPRLPGRFAGRGPLTGRDLRLLTPGQERQRPLRARERGLGRVDQRTADTGASDHLADFTVFELAD